MVRIVVKGGIWKNTEDEILKAAVMKYGFNQWARISSLLVRKSAKQCKARWVEWLSPDIRKTEWSREDEERLLHLAKVMPTQWRTIAPLMGRTATQCLEHYQQLLDQAQRREEEREGGAPAVRDARDDPRRLRPGEIEPRPESKPARPDAVDMDEDEKEMLSEARARLANTKGKKAKRKAREKQLEEARRLAVLQKQREMQAAGLEVKTARLKRGEIDYNSEIPFERRPPPGFFSTRDEDKKAREAKEAEVFKPISVDELKGKSREQIEEEERKRDTKRIRLMRESDLPAVFDQVNRLNDVDMVAKRMSLHLPTPVLQEDELEAIAKLSDRQREEERKQAIESASSHSATRALLTPSFATPLLPSHSARATPMLAAQRTPLAVDNVGKEAENLLRLMNAQTPLLGGENKELHPSDFSRATPVHQPVQTPKPMTPLMSADGSARTPASLHENQQAPSTPLHDGTPSAAFPSPSDVSSTSMTASQALSAHSQRSAQREEKARKSHLKQLLSMLPAPRNEYALSGQQLSGLEDEERKEQTVEDREETDRRERAEEEARRQAEWEKETLAVQRHLPRPSSLPAQYGEGEAEVKTLSSAERRVLQEARALIEWDTRRWPAGSKRPLPQAHDEAVHVDQTRMLHAKKLVAEQQDREPLTRELVATFVASMPTSTASSRGSLSLSALRSAYDGLAATVKKASSKCTVQLGGYHALHSKLRQEIAELEAQLTEKRREHECYNVLQTREEGAIERRMREGMNGLSAMKQEEAALQQQFHEWMLHQSQQHPVNGSVTVNG